MIQTCGKLIDFSLKVLFKTTLEEGKFPGEWKKVMLCKYKKNLREYDKKSIDLIYRLQNFTDCQLLSITHEIYESFDYSPMRDINGNFLNISNAFVKI